MILGDRYIGLISGKKYYTKLKWDRAKETIWENTLWHLMPELHLREQ